MLQNKNKNNTHLYLKFNNNNEEVLKGFKYYYSHIKQAKVIFIN